MAELDDKKTNPRDQIKQDFSNIVNTLSHVETFRLSNEDSARRANSIEKKCIWSVERSQIFLFTTISAKYFCV